MPVTVVVGMYWGDEGKGKIVDYLSNLHDVIVRYQGGANAGHTVKIGEEKYVLHCLPSGVLTPDKENVIGNGMVIDLQSLTGEMSDLAAKNKKYNLYISDSAHLTLPYHIALEKLDGAIGTTKRGIGPTYTTKVERTGVLVGDLKNPDYFREKVQANLDRYKPALDSLGEKFSADDIVAQQLSFYHVIEDMVTDTAYLLDDFLKKGKDILLEGAQGTLLDVSFGTYPLVTSSNTTSGGACTGSGIPPNAITNIIGVLKAYPTRVGEGPMPTLMPDDTNKEVQEAAGDEVGATTRRVRRCGWPDFVAARYAAMINGVTSVALTKPDVFDGRQQIFICENYKRGDKIISKFPASAYDLGKCKPELRSIDGWKNTAGVTSYEKLHDNLKVYVELIERNLEVPVSIISTGKERDSTIICRPELIFPK
jgi:adenylosuccinate synthase